MHDHSVSALFRGTNAGHLERHKHADGLVVPDGRPRVALVGNPNVGKSLFFNYLSGLYVDVSNYPGTTVETTKGHFGEFDVYDTPGVYGISSFTDEERVTREIVLRSDVVLNVVDAAHLERDLFLTQQLIDMGKKVAVFLNCMDEVQKLGLQIDVKLLSNRLGVPVFQSVATRQAGFDQIKAAIEQARKGGQDPVLHHQLHAALSAVGSEAEALLILEGDEAVAERHGVEAENEGEKIYIDRRNRVNLIINTVLSDKNRRTRLSTLVGRWAINMWTGIPMLAAALYLVYLFVGKLVAQELVGFTEVKIGQDLWEPWIRGIVTPTIPADSWLGTILIGEFGVATMTVTYLLFLLLPLVVAFYLSLAIMEDSGYLPRLATLVDRSLNAIGLNGSAVIPLILGFGCVTMATITTRLLGSEREKRITTAVLQFAIPCSAQLAVVTALLAGAGLGALAIYSLTIFAALVALGTLLHRLHPGSVTPLLIDLPPMRVPRLDNIIRKTAFRAYYFMKEATPWFFIGALAVGILQVTGLLVLWQDSLAPLTTGWLQLPREAANAFVMGMVRRDFGAAGLYQLPLSSPQ
ncbi:MAG TPA: ferrous iron transport protein B, partial [Terriglobales bacterium]|nr:ferrous iron transport protein B [Terriglobales bacterium]